MDTRTQEFLEYVQSGGQVETGDWMPDEYRARLDQVHRDARELRAHGSPSRARLDPPRTDAAAEARAHREDPGRGRPRAAHLPRRRGPRQAAERLPRRPRLRQVEVPQRLPLPDEDVGRRRRHRLARGRGGDRLAEGAPQVLVRAVRADHEEDLLGGVVPHPPRPRRDPRAGHGYARSSSSSCRRRSTAGGSRSCSSTGTRSRPRRIRCSSGGSSRRANEEARQQFLEGYVPQIRELGLDDPRSRACARTRRPGRGSTPSPTGRSSARSSPATAPRRQERLAFRRLSREDVAWVEQVVLAEAA